jgi:galactose mutarotase-like enzyme
MQLEDPRISKMYASMAANRLSKVRAKMWRAAVLRSGMLTTAALVVLLGGLIVFVKERGKGHLMLLKAQLQHRAAAPAPAVLPPGGQDAIVLQRTSIAGGTTPEFLTATVLPGRGMNILQITALIPGLRPGGAEVSLLASPSLEETSTLLNGTGADAHGLESLRLGAALEVPWANRLGGIPDNENVMTVWHGLTMILPAGPRDGLVAGGALGGLLLNRKADKIESHVMPDGWETQSVYRAGNFDGHWVSQTEVTTMILLNGRSIEFGVTAKNTGPVAEPMGIGWRPRFVIPSGDRTNTQLRVPSEMRVEMYPHSAGKVADLPTGRLLPVAGTESDFTDPKGARLGSRSIHESFVHLKQGLLDMGPAVELRDVTARFRLRINAMSSSIKEIRVEAPADQSTVLIDPQFNYDDPFGKEWPSNEDTGMVILQPGQSAQWRVRLEILPLAMDQPRF